MLKLVVTQRVSSPKVYGRLSENLPKHAKDTLTSHASFINEEASQRKSKMEQLHQKLNLD